MEDIAMSENLKQDILDAKRKADLVKLLEKEVQTPKQQKEIKFGDPRVVHEPWQ